MKTWIEISENNLLHNFHTFQKLVSPSAVIAVVKANAYGHGLCEVAQILSRDVGFKKNGWLAVDSLDEALTIKKIVGKSRLPILILGYTPFDELDAVVQNGFRQVVYDQEHIMRLQYAAARSKKTAIVHLKLETGTHRQGVSEEDLTKIIDGLRECPDVRLEGAYSHFADVEDVYQKSRTVRVGNPFAAAQFKTFENLLAHLNRAGLAPRLRHMAASAASLLYRETHLDAIRLGIGLYGLYSAPPTAIALKTKLRPALEWKTMVAQVKNVAAGETVGYGRAWKAKKASRIAILPIGYADGYSRRFGNTARVLIHGQVAPIVGRICMNMCMADVTKIKNVTVENEVVLIGRQGNQAITVEELAGLDGTINYEIIARLNPLLARVVV